MDSFPLNLSWMLSDIVTRSAELCLCMGNSMYYDV